MNENLKKFNPEEILFFDIETVRANEELDINSKEFDLFQYKMRNKQTMELPDSMETDELYLKNAALSPTYGKIVCISVAFIRGNTCFYKAITGDEATIINEFYKLIDTHKFKLGGYNILRFDVPFVRVRGIVTGAGSIPSRVNDSGRKPWDLESEILDMMDVIRGCFMNPFSLDESCFMFGVDSPKDDISGAQVSEVYYSEGVKRVATYCNKDIVATVKLYLKLANIDTVTQFIDKTVTESVFERIVRERQLTADTIQELLLKTKDLKKKADKKNLVELIKASLNKETYTVEEEQLFDKLMS